MKKKNILVAVLCFLVAITLTGCSKKVLTTTEFTSRMQNNNFITGDVTTQFEEAEFVKEATIAKSPDGWQIEFYVLSSESTAKAMFETNKERFIESKDGNSGQTSSNIGNYETFSLTSNGKYMYLCRVDNTLIYLNVDSTYKSNAQKIVKELGY